MMAYAYFPGCSAHGTAKEYDQSTRSVCARLEIELKEIPEWICCGASPAHAVNPLLSFSLVAKNLDLSPTNQIVTGCAACFNRFKTTLYTLQHDRTLWEQVRQIVQPAKLNGSDFRVAHLLEVICKDFGLDNLKERVVKPLNGLKVACYYGCLLVRPPKIMAFDDPDNPTKMDELMKAIGAEPVEWEFKTECCGAFHAIPHPEIVLALTSKILQAAKDTNADVISVACPMCQINLDLRQLDLKKQGKNFDIPVLYFTQILGLALGIAENELGLDRLIIDPRPKLRERQVV
ncbi:MAG: CoB--CoM heterodisulfide reductase iron-sulfur subunit B family protein [Armatimonadota bacterium]